LTKLFLSNRKTDGAPTISGLVSQLIAVGTHYVSSDRLDTLRRRLKEFNSPILILTGTEDHLVRPINSAILRKALKCPLTVFDGVGHHIHQEVPESFNKTVEGILGQAKAESLADGIRQRIARL